MAVFDDSLALELIEEQLETALKLEKYWLTRPRYSPGVLVAVATGVASAVVIAVALLIASITSVAASSLVPGGLLGVGGFMLARMIAELTAENERAADQLLLGDLVTDDGALSNNGALVLHHLKALRAQGTVEVVGSTTPEGALSDRAKQSRAALKAGVAPPAIDAGQPPD